MTDYDVVVVGAGPGGLTAAMYTARARLRTAVLEKGRVGGQAATTEQIENYPGFPEGTAGPELMERFAAQARRFGAEFIRDEALGLSADGLTKAVRGKAGTYFAKVVILAPGAEPRPLGIKGERALRGKGVSYCATCDADFYTDLDVVIVGNGDAALEEAIYLARFVNKASMVVVHDEGVVDATRVIAERAFAEPKLDWVWNSVLEEIAGDGLVESVRIRNLKTGAAADLPCHGVFIFVGTMPKTGFLKDGPVELDAQGYIKAGDLMETSVDGVYAVGDARGKYLRQVVTAAGDAATAAVAAERYVHEEESFRLQVLDQAGPVFVAFWSPASQEALAFLPVLETFASGHADGLRLVKIDTYKNRRIAERYGVQTVPTTLAFAGGRAVARLEGAVCAEALAAALQETVGHRAPQGGEPRDAAVRQGELHGPGPG